MGPLIRPLDPISDLDAVADLYAGAADYWMLAEGRAPDRAKAAAFFTDGPPGSDAGRAHRLGIFEGTKLAGVAEVSFGFPEPRDAYLGLMLLDPAMRGRGTGAALLQEVERRARAAGAGRLFLGVLQANPRGRAFWERQGFSATGVSRSDPETGHLLHRLGKDLAGGKASRSGRF